MPFSLLPIQRTVAPSKVPPSSTRWVGHDATLKVNLTRSPDTHTYTVQYRKILIVGKTGAERSTGTRRDSQLSRKLRNFMTV